MEARRDPNRQAGPTNDRVQAEIAEFEARLEGRLLEQDRTIAELQRRMKALEEALKLLGGSSAPR